MTIARRVAGSSADLLCPATPPRARAQTRRSRSRRDGSWARPRYVDGHSRERRTPGGAVSSGPSMVRDWSEIGPRISAQSHSDRLPKYYKPPRNCPDLLHVLNFSCVGAPWCNGSTGVFGTSSGGSNPPGATGPGSSRERDPGPFAVRLMSPTKNPRAVLSSHPEVRAREVWRCIESRGRRRARPQHALRRRPLVLRAPHRARGRAGALALHRLRRRAARRDALSRRNPPPENRLRATAARGPGPFRAPPNRTNLHLPSSVAPL
jgi:hypothetical protein